MSLALFKHYNKPLLLLALPLLGAHLAQTGMSVADTIMAGRLSAVDLAAVAVGSSVFMPLLLLLFGTLMATTPLVAQANGAGNTSILARTIQQAGWTSLLVILPIAFILYNSRAIFDFMSVTPEVASLGANYLKAIAWGLPAVAVFQVLRCMCEGLNHARPILLISLTGLLLNIPLNYVLIYGEFGFPKLGAVGCGYATAMSFWFMAALLGLYVHLEKRYRKFAIFGIFHAPSIKEIGGVLWLGLPIGLSIFVEASLFTVITLFIGEMGRFTVAGHQVALNFTGLLFMVPLSLGLALTVKVGHAVGAKRLAEARQIAFYGIGLAFFIAIISSLFMWVAADLVVKLYSPNLQVQLLAASLIQLAVWYQISDAIQINAAGALRGYKDTRIIMLITLFSYWMIGLAGGWWLAMTDNFWGAQGVYGFWYGLIAGLTVAASILMWRLHSTSRVSV